MIFETKPFSHVIKSVNFILLDRLIVVRKTNQRFTAILSETEREVATRRD